MRVAAAAAQAIAFARGIPVCRMSRLAVLAAGAGRVMGAEWVATCLDARMERAYVALYRAAPGQMLVAALRTRGSIPATSGLPGVETVRGRRRRLARRTRTFWPGMALGSRPSTPDLLPSAGDLLSMAIAEFQRRQDRYAA